MTRHLWLDLEDTIIMPVMDGWFNTRLINLEKIKAFIAEFKPDFVHIFSFAVHNEAERLRFNLGSRPSIEGALGIKLGFVPTVDDEIIPACCKVLNISIDAVTFSDACDFWSKQESFRLFMRHHHKNTHLHGGPGTEVVLLDDAVYNENFEFPDIKVKGKILNIDQLEIPNGINEPGTTTVPCTD